MREAFVSTSGPVQAARPGAITSLGRTPRCVDCDLNDGS